MFAFSVGPLYGLAYGLSLRTSLAVSAAVSLALVTGAYYAFVHRAAPVSAGVGTDAARLYYLALALGAVLLGLSLPLLEH